MAGSVAGAAGGDLPGSLTLLDLFEEHPVAVAFDWRTRFGMPSSAVGEEMTFGEAWLLVQALSSDPSSRMGAALAGWSKPWSHESLVLADLFDLQHAAASTKGRPKPYPRPWVKSTERRTMRPDPSLTQDQILAALRRAGHDTL